MYELYINGELVSVYEDYSTAEYEAGHIIKCGDDIQIVDTNNNEHEN